MEGQVGHGEDGEHDDDQMDGLLPERRIVHVVVNERLDDKAVAAKDDHEGHAEPKHGHAHTVDEVPWKLILGGRIIARRDVSFRSSTRIVEDRRDPGYHDEPNQGAGAHSVLLLQSSERLERVDNAGVAVHADARQKQDAPVEVDVKDEALQAARDVTEDPVGFVKVVEYEEGKWEHIAEVSQREVEHVNRNAAPRTHVTHEHPYGQAVPDEASDEDDDVDCGKVVELKSGFGQRAAACEI